MDKELEKRLRRLELAEQMRLEAEQRKREEEFEKTLGEIKKWHSDMGERLRHLPSIGCLNSNYDLSAPIPGETTVMSEEKVYRLCEKPMEEARKTGVFDYLHRWRCDGGRCSFVFDKYSIAV